MRFSMFMPLTLWWVGQINYNDTCAQVLWNWQLQQHKQGFKDICAFIEPLWNARSIADASCYQTWQNSNHLPLLLNHRQMKISLRLVHYDNRLLFHPFRIIPFHLLIFELFTSTMSIFTIHTLLTWLLRSCLIHPHVNVGIKSKSIL